MKDRGAFGALATAEIASWAGGNRLLYFAAATVVGIVGAPLFISFTFGSDHVIYTDVVVSSLWMLVIAGTSVLAVTATCEDMEARRHVLLRMSGISSQGTVAAKVAAVAVGGALIWTAAAGCSLMLLGDTVWAKAFGISMTGMTLAVTGVPVGALKRARVAAWGAVPAAAVTGAAMIAVMGAGEAAPFIVVYPVCCALGAAGVFAGANFRLPVALAVMAAVWGGLFIAQGAGAESGLLRTGFPLLEIGPEAGANLASGEAAVAIMSFGLSAVCIMGLSIIWTAYTITRREI